MTIHIVLDGICQVLTVVVFLNGGWQILSVPTIDVLGTSTTFFINGSNDNIEDPCTNKLRFLTLCQQHADIEERTKIKEADLRRVLWDINVLNKSQLKLFQ